VTLASTTSRTTNINGIFFKFLQYLRGLYGVIQSFAKVSSHLTKNAQMMTFASYSIFSVFNITIFIFIVGLLL